MTRIAACQTDAIAPGACLRLATNPPIAIANVDGAFHGFYDICPHSGARLSDSAVCNGEIVCPWHGARFDARTGRVLSPPAQRDLIMLPVSVSDETVFVDVPG